MAMYNRYIPAEGGYTRIVEEDAPPFHPPEDHPGPHAEPERREPKPDFTPPEPEQAPEAPAEKKPGGISSLLKGLKLDDLDTGDILLLLIILFLFLDGDDIELMITLGLLLVLGLD